MQLVLGDCISAFLSPDMVNNRVQYAEKKRTIGLKDLRTISWLSQLSI